VDIVVVIPGEVRRKVVEDADELLQRLRQWFGFPLQRLDAHLCAARQLSLGGKKLISKRNPLAQLFSTACQARECNHPQKANAACGHAAAAPFAKDWS